MATEICFAVPAGSLDVWKERFREKKVKHGTVAERFGESYLSFQDPDGLQLCLTVPAIPDLRQPWITNEVSAAMATRGFHSVLLTLRNTGPTAGILTGIFGYRLLQQEGNYSRYVTDAVQTAACIDLLEIPNGKPGVVAGGTNHHVAFRVKDEETLMAYREKIVSAGLHITEKIDRNYFFSLYFREPGGILFEIATDNPGFAVDESREELGTHLKLPAQYENNRSQIEKILPVLNP